MTEKVLFFFSALGVFNALLLSGYLIFFKPSQSRSDRFTGILILFLSIRVGVSCFHFFETVPQEVIKLGLVSNLLIGPALLFLMKSLIHPKEHHINQSLIHLGFWSIIVSMGWFLFDFHTWDWKIRFIIHFSLTTYLVYIVVRWRKEFTLFLKSESPSSDIRRAILLYLAVLSICAGFAVSLFTNYILGPLVFTMIFYWVTGYFMLSKGKERNPTSSRKIEPTEFERLNQRLLELMEKEKLYKNPDLSLESLARQLAISRHLLSQLLNENLDKSFYQYINDYRIEEACIMLKNKSQYSIEAIGYEVGFNSRSSFFSSFKKLKGQTPSKYREEV